MMSRGSQGMMSRGFRHHPNGIMTKGDLRMMESRGGFARRNLFSAIKIDEDAYGINHNIYPYGMLYMPI
jgi:hypothetical protein